MGITNSNLEEVRIGVRLKMSALWIAELFLYAFGDLFGFFRRGVIEDVIAGEISGIEITQTLTLVLRPRLNGRGRPSVRARRSPRR